MSQLFLPTEKKNTIQTIFDAFLTNQRIFENKEALELKYVPDEVLHRDKEMQAVAEILAPSLRLEKPSNLFIYGKTGTGKSLVAKFVCKQLSDAAEKANIPIKTIYINCKMKKVADTEYRLLAELSRQLGEKVPPTGLPTEEIYNKFYEAVDKEKQVVIIILDEIDHLVSKSTDEVIYNLTRINEDLKNAKISLIGISNNIRFKELIGPRSRSSLGEEELVFPPYDALQLKDILQKRAEIAFKKDVLEEGVIPSCAALAAREHGDARRALNLLRVAGEIAEREKSFKVKPEHVELADEKIERESVIELVKSLPKQSQIILYSILLTLADNNPPIYTSDVYNTYKEVCSLLNVRELTARRQSSLLSELDMLGIIDAKIISKGRHGRKREISLSISSQLVPKIMQILKEVLNI